jgi:hypothetical protein
MGVVDNWASLKTSAIPCRKTVRAQSFSVQEADGTPNSTSICFTKHKIAVPSRHQD